MNKKTITTVRTSELNETIEVIGSGATSATFTKVDILNMCMNKLLEIKVRDDGGEFSIYKNGILILTRTLE